MTTKNDFNNRSKADRSGSIIGPEFFAVALFFGVVAYLVRVYSLSPECRFMAENVPIQPLNRLSLPIFQVTNSGLKDRKEKQISDNGLLAVRDETPRQTPLTP